MIKRTLLIALSLSLPALLTGCASQSSRPNTARTIMAYSSVEMTLDTFHEAAKLGLFDLYFDQMTDDVVFMGTDKTERWNKQQFMDYAREHFTDGQGWDYTPTKRTVEFNGDYSIAWVDELLTNEKYGTLRGTAVLRKADDRYRIGQYSLTFLVPNGAASKVVETIKQYEESND